jgi:hypothetical protein
MNSKGIKKGIKKKVNRRLLAKAAIWRLDNCD